MPSKPILIRPVAGLTVLMAALAAHLSTCLPQITPFANTTIAKNETLDPAQTKQYSGWITSLPAGTCYDQPISDEEPDLIRGECNCAIDKFHETYKEYPEWYLRPESLAPDHLPSAPYFVHFGSCVVSIRTNNLEAVPMITVWEAYHRLQDIADACTQREGHGYRYGGEAEWPAAGQLGFGENVMVKFGVMHVRRYMKLVEMFRREQQGLLDGTFVSGSLNQSSGLNNPTAVAPF